MTDKSFFVRLTLEDRLRVRIITSLGHVESFAVQYETMVDDEFRPVVRYDTAHGHGHRDILEQSGETLDKEFLDRSFDHKASLDYAVRDLRDNWDKYRKQYLERNG